VKRWFKALLLALLVSPSAFGATYKYKAGDSVQQLAIDHYGHKDYSLVIVKLNKIKDPKQIAPGTPIRLPDLKDMLLNEGFPKNLEPQLEAVMKARYGFIKVREELIKALRPGNSKGKIQIPVAVRDELRSSADLMEKAGKELAKAGNFSDSATRMRQRLVTCAGNLRKLARGSQEKGLEESVHLLIAQAFVRGLMWAYNEDGDVK
jgi:LysM repeat protein